MCRQRAGCNAGTLRARSLVEAAARDVQAKGRLQPWNSKGWRPKELGGSCREGCAGKGQAATLEQQRLTAKGLGGSCREGCAGKGQAATLEQQRLTARGLGGSWGLNAPTTERYVQAKGRLQCWNSRSWRPEGLVEAATRELEGFKRFKGFKGLKPGKRQAWMP